MTGAAPTPNASSGEAKAGRAGRKSSLESAAEDPENACRICGRPEWFHEGGSATGWDGHPFEALGQLDVDATPKSPTPKAGECEELRFRVHQGGVEWCYTHLQDHRDCLLGMSKALIATRERELLAAERERDELKGLNRELSRQREKFCEERDKAVSDREATGALWHDSESSRMKAEAERDALLATRERELGEERAKLDRERLASMIHDEWVTWARGMLDNEQISRERAERWRSMFVPYAELPEKVKDQDRKWADKVRSRPNAGKGE